MRSERPLVIGQAPGPNTDPGRPLSGRCGARLAGLCGVSPSAFERRFERLNLLPWFPGKAGKGDLFPIDDARKAAVRLLVDGRMAGRPVVLLGDNVTEAFGLRGRVDKLRWLRRGDLRLALCPHPSGVNRWWNAAENEAAAARFWRRLARRTA